MTIWFSASCNFTILPNSFGLPALPLRMTSVDGSNRLRSLPSLRVLPRKMRALVCFITCLTCRAFGSCDPSDVQQPQFHAPGPVAQLSPGRSSDLGDLLHETGQHPNPIPQQGAVGRVVDIGLDHRRVYAHPPSRGHAIVLGYSDHAFVDLFEHFRPECQAPTA